MVKPHLFQLASTSYLSTSYMLTLISAIYAQIPELICILKRMVYHSSTFFNSDFEIS